MGNEAHSNIDRYVKWIAEYVGEDKGYAKCDELTKAMQQAFPDLERRNGFFNSVSWGRRSHWWLRTPAGDIVDPSGCQHPDGLHFPLESCKYEDLTDCTETEMADRVPSGVCMNCGDSVYHGASACSSACEGALHRYYNCGGMYE